MSISVILRVKCDGFRSPPGSSLKKQCGVSGEFETANIVASKNASTDAGWTFDTTGKKDKCYCPKCGPIYRPHEYKK